jgi:hypothetical protein
VSRFDGMAQPIEILMNEAMKLERSEVLRAARYQRTEERSRGPIRNRGDRF